MKVSVKHRRDRLRNVVVLLLVWLMVFFPGTLCALPQGEKVVSGSATFERVNSRTLRIKTSKKAIIDYESFGIGKEELVRFLQPSKSSIVLNRVVGKDPSRILGKLLANGRVFLINPNGILFGKSARIDTGSFLASTLEISNGDFLGGRYEFHLKAGYEPSFIINRGVIKAAPGGFVVLASPLVVNSGRIEAKAGRVVIAGTSGFTLDFEGDGLISFFIPSDTPVEGDVELPFKRLPGVLRRLVNMEGVKQACSIEEKDGVIRLVGGAGTSFQKGLIDVSGYKGASGGQVLLSSSRRTVVGVKGKILADGKGTGTKGGEVRVLSQGDTLLSGGVLKARGGKGGEGGFIEVSALGRVDLGGARIDTSAPGGKGGSFLLDPEEVIISNDLYYHGGDAAFVADRSITVQEGVTISTRQISGGDTRGAHLTQSSVGDSGSLTLEAPQITVGDGAALLTFANNGYKGGDITLKAVDDRGDITHAAQATVELVGARLKGRDVVITATARSADEFSDGDSAIEQVLDFLNDLPTSPAGVSIARAHAEVTVGEGTRIEGDNITLSSTASTDAKVLTLFTALGVAYGESSPTARVAVEDGATIKASGDLSLTSEAFSAARIRAYTVNLGSGRGAEADVTLAYCRSEGEATVLVESGARLEARGNLEVKASLTQDLSTEALGGAYEDGTVGVGVAITQSTSQVGALLDGEATAGGDVAIGANIEVEKNKTASTSAVGSGLVAHSVISAGNGVLNGVEGFLKAHSSNPDPRSNSQKVALSAAFTYAHHEEEATARIGDGAVVTSQGGSIDVESAVDYPQGSTRGIQTSAVATIDSRDTSRKEYSVAGAVDITEFTNEARAYIGKNAVVNASKGISLESRIYIPYEITWQEIHGVEDITDKLNPNIGIQNGFFTTWAQSNSKGTVMGVAGTVDIFTLSNTSQAYIGEGARVNQASAYRSPDQKVSIKAVNDTQTMNLSGVFGLKGVGTGGGKAGIGGAYLQVNYTSNTSALIEKGSRVYAECLSVQAHSSDRNISIAESGGMAEKYSLNGTFSLLSSDVTTLAQVEGGAQVESGGGIVDENGNGLVDAGEDASVFIDAEEESQLYNVAGGVTKGKNVGIGASVSINDIERETRALVGDEEGGGGTISSLGNIELRASSGGQISSWSLAAALAVDTPSYVAANDPLDGVSLPALFGDTRSGVSIAGDASINSLSGTTEAAILGGSLFSSGNTTLSAVEDGSINALAGSVAITSASGTSVGLAGSCTVNEVATTTQAYLRDATVRSSGRVALSAQSSGSVKTIAASGSGARSFGPGFSGSVAGSLSVNRVANKTLTYLERSHLEAGGEVSLSSVGRPLIHSIAGSMAAGGKAGVGAGIAINAIDNQVESYSYESDVDTGGSLSLAAETQGEIKTLAGSLGLAVQGVTVSGSVSINDLSDSTRAYIYGERSTGGVVASGDITLSARDESDILVGAGQVDYGAACGAGAAVVYNDVANDVETYARDVDLTSSGGSVCLDAHSGARILTVAAGAALSSVLGMAGSVVVNGVSNTTRAYISSSRVEADGSLVAVAQGSNEIEVYDGTFSGGGSYSVGGSATVNTVENTTDAHISDSEVKARGNSTSFVPRADGSGSSQEVRGVAVVATSEDDLTLRTANLSEAPSMSLAATVSVNIFRDDTKAYISGSQVNGDNQGSHEGQGVMVAAYGGVTSDVGAGGAAFGSTAGYGATSDTTILENSTRAFLEGSHLDALGDVDVTSTTRERVNSVVVSGTLTGGVSLAGSVAVVKSATLSEAYIENSQVSSGGNLLVRADDEVLLGVGPDGSERGIIAGAASMGMLGGLGGSVVVNTVSNTTRAYITHSTTNAYGTTSVRASGLQRVCAYVVTGALGGYVGAAGSVAVNSIGVTTEAYVEGSLVNGEVSYANDGQNVEVVSRNLSSIKSSPGNVAAGLVGVGASIDVSSIRNSVSAYLGDGVEVSAGNDVEVSASSEERVDSTVLAFGGGALSVQGSVSIVNLGSAISDSGSEAAQDTGERVDDNISGSRVGSMLGDAEAGNRAKEKADEETNGLSVARDFDTGAQFNQATAAYVGEDAVVRAGGALRVNSERVVQVHILSGEGSVGILGVGGAVGIATIRGGASAYVGEGSRIYSDGDVVIKATSQVKDSSVDAYAGSAGAVGLGAAVAYMDSENSARAYLGEEARVPRARSLSVEADMDTSIFTEAFSASAGVGAVGLVDSRATEHGGAWAYLDKGVQVGSPEDSQDEVGSLYVKSSTHTSLSALSLSASGGVVSVNGARAKGEGYLTSQASVMDGARVDVDGDVIVQSDSDNTVEVDATGGQGGLLTVGGTYVEGWLTDNTWSTVGSGVLFDAGGTVGLYASDHRAYVETSATQDSGGAVTINQVEAISNITSSTRASLGDGTQVAADTFEMRAEDLDVYAYAYGYSKTYAVDSESDATSRVNLNATTLVDIGQDAAVTAPTAINLVSVQDSVRSYTKAYTEIGVGVTGTLNSTVDNRLDANSKIETRPGSTLKTKNLYVHAETPTVEGGYTRVATTKANTVVHWTLEVVGQVCKWTWKILTFGLWDGHQLCKPLKKWVAHILHSDTTQHVSGHENRNSSIVFNSDVTIMGGGNPWLYVDSSGNVRSKGDISYRILADRIVVDQVAPPQEGKVVFDSPTGTISGNASFTFEKAYESVKITNDSSRDLEIGDIHTFNRDQEEPDLLVGVAHRDGFHYTRTTNMDETVVDIACNGHYSSVYLNGHIDNPGGTTMVLAREGDILSEESGSLIETRVLYLTARRGSIGSPAFPINLRFVEGYGLAPSVEVYAKGDVHIASSSLLTEGGGPLEVVLKSFTVGGDLYFVAGQSYKAELVDDPDCPECGRKVLVYVPVDSTYRLEDLLAAGDISLLASSSVTLDVEGTVTSGLKDIDFTIGPDGDISSNLFDYEDYVTPTSIVLEDLGNKGGHIFLTAGALTGSGTLRVLDGYSQVHVVNNSGKDLVLNDVTVRRIAGKITFNGSPLELPGNRGGVDLTTYGYSQGRIEADNTGSSTLRVQGQLTTDLGPVSLRSAGGDILQESGSGIDAGGDVNVEAGGDYLQREGSSLRSAGWVDVEAAGDVVVDRVEAVEGIRISSGGALSETGDAGVDLVAARLVIVAGRGVGDGDPLETAVDWLDVRNEGGDVRLSNKRDVTLADLSGDGYGVKNDGGEVTVESTGFIAVSSPIEARGDVNLTSQGDLRVDSSVLSETGQIDLEAQGSITQGVAGRVTAYGDVQATAITGSIVMEDGAVTETERGNIAYTARGDVSIGRLVTSTDRDRRVVVTSETGSILDSGDLGLYDVTTHDLLLSAATGVGFERGEGDALELQVARLEAVNTSSGDLLLRNYGPLILQSLSGSGPAVNNEGGSICITATSSLTVEDQAVAAGSVTLAAGESDGMGDDLTINADISARNGSVLLRAGDHILQSAHTLVVSSAPRGSVTLVAGYRDVDGMGSICQEDPSTIKALGSVAMYALGDVCISRVMSAASGVTLVSRRGNILDNNGPRGNIYAHGDTHLWAGGIIGRYDDPLDVKIKGGNLYVYAGEELHRISANLVGTVDPSNRARVYYGLPPGLVLFNNRLMGGARTPTFLSAVALCNYWQLEELMSYGLLLEPEDMLKKRTLPW